MINKGWCVVSELYSREYNQYLNLEENNYWKDFLVLTQSNIMIEIPVRQKNT